MNKQGTKYKVSPSGRRKLDYPSKSFKPSKKLPLVGKTIYLDVKESKHVKRLREDLKKLGATLEDFASRDINYLITSQPRPKNKFASPGGDESPTPSPFNCDPSPSPSYHEDKIVTSVTRGKALLEKARYTRQASTLLDNAEKWGVKIVSIEGAFKWITIELKKLPRSSKSVQKKSKSQCVSSYKMFKSPYVKLETERFCYRPFYVELEVWPRLNVDTPRGSCPFDGTLIKCGEESREERGELLAAQVDIPSEDTPNEEKDGYDSADSITKQSVDVKRSESDVGGSRILTAGELKRRKELKKKLERKRGYCECCHVKYEDLDKHVKEEQHRQYVKTKANYNQLDALIQSGPNKQHFLYEYLTKAAQIGNKKLDSEKCVRRSPRKIVPDSPCNINYSCNVKQSVVGSPRKCHMPGETGISVKDKQSVRVSPRKNPATKSDTRSVDVPKSTDLHTLESICPGNEKASRKSNTKKNEKVAKSTIFVDSEGLGGKENIPPCTGMQKFEIANTHRIETSGQSYGTTNEIDYRRKDSTVDSSVRRKHTEKTAIGNTEKTIVSNSNKNVEGNSEKLVIGISEKQGVGNSETPGVDNVEKTVALVGNVENYVKELSEKFVCDSNKKAVYNVEEYELIKDGFTVVVNHGKKRTEIEQSSDDFEVCFTRSLQETLSISSTEKENAVEKTFDQMVQLYEKNNSGRVTSKPCLDDNFDKSCSSHKKDNSNVENDTSFERKGSKSSTKLIKKEEILKSKDRKEKDMFNFDMDSDSLSDFQCYDGEGNVVRYSKTLAERIKERSLSRKTSVESYNVNALFQLSSRSRSNSFSSNKSETVSFRVQLAKSKKGFNSILKKKTIGSIASAKVVHKYKKKKFDKAHKENALNGYQGDDENERTPNLQQTKPGQKKQKSKFWYFEPVVENKINQEVKNKKLSGLQKELLELDAANSWYSSDNNDSDTKRSRTKSSQVENTKLKSDMVTNKDIMKDNRDATSNLSQEFDEVSDDGIKVEVSDNKKRGTNNENEISNLKHTKPGQKKPKSKFWYFEPVVENKTNQEVKNKKLSGLRKELLELDTANSWFSSDNYDSDTKRSQIKSSRVEDTKFKSDMVTCKNIMKGKRVFLSNSSQRLDEHNDEGIKVVVSDNDEREKKSSNQRSEIPLTIHEIDTKSKKVKDLGHNSINTELSNKRRDRRAKNKTVCDLYNKDSVVQENDGFLIPNELIDSWNNGVTLDRSQRRKNQSTYIEYDTDDTSDDLSKTSSGQTTNDSLQKHNQASIENKNLLSSKSKVRRKFWELIPVAIDEADGHDINVPKVLRDSWNTGESLERHERRKNRKAELIVSRTNENMACVFKQREITKVNNNKEGETKAKFVESKKVKKDVKCNNDKRFMTNFDGNDSYGIDEGGSIEHKRVLRGLRYFETYNDSSDTSCTETTKVLRARKKKTLHSYHVRKRDNRVNYDESQLSSCHSDYSDDVELNKKMCKVRLSKQNSKKNQEAKSSCMQTSTEYKSSDVENCAKSKNERSRSKTRRVGPNDETCVNVTKSLPKELQLLQDTWNDLNTVHKWSRTNQSGFTGGIKTYDRHVKKCEKSEQRQCSYDDMIVDEEDTDKGSSSLIQSEEDNGRSNSPVFRMTKKSKFRVERRKSPVFNRSPHQVHNKPNENSLRNDINTNEKLSPIYDINGICNKQVNCSNVRANNNPRGSKFEFNDGCTNKSGESERFIDKQEIKMKNMTNCTGKSVKTHQKCSPPREERLKCCKRKNTETACQGVKKRRVDHHQINKTPRRRLMQLEEITTHTANHIENIGSLSKGETKSDCYRNTEDQFPLIWKPVGGDKKGNSEKEKLNRSWTMLSERSVSKILSSEVDTENFEGFTNEDKLPSDMSCKEQCEVELPKDDQHEWFVEDSTDGESEVEENLVNYVPEFFPSPNKTSNSSWNDAVEGYIENSVSHGPNSSFKVANSSAYFSFTDSPRSPSRHDCVSQIRGSGHIHSCRTLGSPKRGITFTPKSKKKVHNESVERVDAEIEFNFGSPQKNRSDFSPLRSVNGMVRNLSVTPTKTSTPAIKKVKGRSYKNTK